MENYLDLYPVLAEMPRSPKWVESSPFKHSTPRVYGKILILELDETLRVLKGFKVKGICRNFWNQNPMAALLGDFGEKEHPSLLGGG